MKAALAPVCEYTLSDDKTGVHKLIQVFKLEVRSKDLGISNNLNTTIVSQSESLAEKRSQRN